MALGMNAVRESAPALKRQTMPRAKRAAIVGIPVFFILAVTGSASLGLILAALIFAALYIPAWSTLPAFVFGADSFRPPGRPGSFICQGTIPLRSIGTIWPEVQRHGSGRRPPDDDGGA